MALLLYDDSVGGGKFVRSLVPSKSYDPFYREIAEAAAAYIDRYEKVPGEHTIDIFDVLREKHPNQESIYTKIYSSIKGSWKEGLNRDYILTRAKLFIRHQQLRRGMTKAIDMLQTDDEGAVLQAEQALNESLKQSYDLFDAGTFLTDSNRSLGFLGREHDVIPTGIPQLDDLDLGPARGEMHMLIAPYGKGKSWWLQNLAKHALLNQFRTVYITLEMDELYVCQRIMQNLFSIGKRESKAEFPIFDKDELGRFVSMEPKLLEGRPTLMREEKIRRLLRKKLGGIKSRAPLVVRQFPTSSLTINELDAYLDSLEASHNFVPDFLIIDYVDLMHIEDAGNLRLELGQLVKKARGLGIKRNMAVATVSQSNREGGDAKKLRGKHVGEDWSKLGTADVVITYSQTEAEHALGLARLYVDKGRKEKDRFTVLISQAYGIGQFCMDSVGMASSYWKAVEKKEETGD